MIQLTVCAPKEFLTTPDPVVTDLMLHAVVYRTIRDLGEDLDLLNVYVTDAAMERESFRRLWDVIECAVQQQSLGL